VKGSRFFYILYLFVAVLLSGAPLLAELPKDAKASLSSAGQTRGLRFSPLSLDGGSTLTVISPANFNPLADRLTQHLGKIHAEFASLLGNLPAFSTSIRLIDEESFYAVTGAPQWTNAMFYRGQIIIPLSLSGNHDFESLSRSVRHEYTHAVVHMLSKGRCPGWLDEGLAQWIEGNENPALMPALLSWLKNKPPIQLELLQGGFTKLRSEMVAPAYAQSLYSANHIIGTYGFKSIRLYLDLLRAGAEKNDAFKTSFGLDETQFEARLGTVLKSWTASHSS